MDSPPSRDANGVITSGILKFCFKESTRQLLTLGLDRRVTYWNLD